MPSVARKILKHRVRSSRTWDCFIAITYSAFVRRIFIDYLAVIQPSSSSLQWRLEPYMLRSSFSPVPGRCSRQDSQRNEDPNDRRQRSCECKLHAVNVRSYLTSPRHSCAMGIVVCLPGITISIRSFFTLSCEIVSLLILQLASRNVPISFLRLRRTASRRCDCLLSPCVVPVLMSFFKGRVRC